MIDVKELRVLNQKDCRCGYYEFTLDDVRSVEQLQDAHGFYGNLVKHYATAICSECGKETILLLKQAGQTWEIMNTAISTNELVIENPQDANIEKNASYTEQDAQVQLTENTSEQTETENKEEDNQVQEFICPECKKVCKNKIGLTAHMKTHQK